MLHPLVFFPLFIGAFLVGAAISIYLVDRFL